MRGLIYINFPACRFVDIVAIVIALKFLLSCSSFLRDWNSVWFLCGLSMEYSYIIESLVENEIIFRYKR
jgi:hypothetical protein